MTIIVGAFSFVWRPRQFWPLVCEQHDALDGPSVVVWNRWPFYGPGAPSFGATIHKPTKPFIMMSNADEHTGDPKATERVINMALGKLQSDGAEVALWLDDDFLFDLDDFRSLVKFIQDHPPGWWRVQTRHYWRSFSTTYSRGAFRFAMPTTARWPFLQTDEISTQDLPHEFVCHHPSWVGSDEEIEQKVQSWYHAQDGFFKDYMTRWRSGAADKEQDLQPADVEMSDGLKQRLEKWRCLEGL